jgi:hypothetical protein
MFLVMMEVRPNPNVMGSGTHRAPVSLFPRYLGRCWKNHRGFLILRYYTIHRDKKKAPRIGAPFLIYIVRFNWKRSFRFGWRSGASPQVWKVGWGLCHYAQPTYNLVPLHDGVHNLCIEYLRCLALLGFIPQQLCCQFSSNEILVIRAPSPNNQ